MIVPVTIANGLKNDVTQPLSRVTAERAAVLRSAAHQLGARTDIFQLGPRPDLLGRRAGTERGRSARIDARLDYARVRLGGGHKVLAFVDGTVAGRPGGVVAIAVNGRIVATCRSFRFRGRTRWGAVVPPSTLHEGRNSVLAYRVKQAARRAP